MKDEDVGMFWMVWSPQGRAPTVRHSSRELAEKEADRLARTGAASVFYVLRAEIRYSRYEVVRTALHPVESWADRPF